MTLRIKLQNILHFFFSAQVYTSSILFLLLSTSENHFGFATLFTRSVDYSVVDTLLARSVNYFDVDNHFKFDISGGQKGDIFGF